MLEASMITRESHSGILTVGEDRLEYAWIAATDRQATPLVFLHEGLGCVSLWRDFPAAVAAATGRGTLVFSRRGYGGSSPVALPRSVRYMHDEGLEVLPRLLDACGFDRVVLIGHSDGASISLIHAGGGDPDGRVRGLILEAPHVFNEEACVAGIRLTRTAFETTALRDKLARHHGANVDIAFHGWNDTWLSDDFWHWNIEEFLPRITAPTLVIQGAEDEYATHAQYDAISAQVGGPCDVLVLDDCRHNPHREQRDATLTAMTTFLGDL